MSKEIIARTSILLDAPVATVWNAVTDPAEVKKYFFGTDLVTSWKVGEPIYFRGEWEGQAYEDKGTVLRYEPQKQLQYDYFSSFSDKEDLPENYQTITYEVEPRDGKTLLSITQTNVPTTEQKDHSEENWNMVLQELKKLVEG
ncbi:SRPBCC family protein [Flavilitoribacter nigricans]|uniref:ATPase n=1 Tax=Flavilitoribacter nigricans (strain ATCC 23147 / DSM 23189 / NBRC 102662 / NCIMB 1420 / SS-2) TaxID=1122177 RepID=A0A2D0N872_FLAN2|nr:SRPBCC family protein [Flavilitoribacter nigricans]PHN04714.1 ATPase [Flavilitoribacter nigricans DSM 23189 = NBRC 102662]